MKLVGREDHALGVRTSVAHRDDEAPPWVQRIVHERRRPERKNKKPIIERERQRQRNGL
jgi:hypothetical protein